MRFRRARVQMREKASNVVSETKKFLFRKLLSFSMEHLIPFRAFFLTFVISLRDSIYNPAGPNGKTVQNGKLRHHVGLRLFLFKESEHPSTGSGADCVSSARVTRERIVYTVPRAKCVEYCRSRVDGQHNASGRIEEERGGWLSALRLIYAACAGIKCVARRERRDRQNLEERSTFVSPFLRSSPCLPAANCCAGFIRRECVED